MTFPQPNDMTVLKSYSVVVDKAAEVPTRYSSKPVSRLNIASAFSAQPCDKCRKPLQKHQWLVSSAGRIVDCG